MGKISSTSPQCTLSIPVAKMLREGEKELVACIHHFIVFVENRWEKGCCQKCGEVRVFRSISVGVYPKKREKVD